MKAEKVFKNIFLGSLCFVAAMVIILFFLVETRSIELKELARAVNIDLGHSTAEIAKIKTICDENKKMSRAIKNLLYKEEVPYINKYFSGPIFYHTLKLIAMNGNYDKEVYESWIKKLEYENRNMKMFIKRLEHIMNTNNAR